MTSKSEHMPGDEDDLQRDPDVVSDPNLDDPNDPSSDEGTSSDWTSEGGAMATGPATHPRAGHEDGD